MTVAEPAMEWLEASVVVDAETAEAVAEVLSRYAYEHGVVIESGPEVDASGPVTVRAYLSIDAEVQANRQRVREALWHLGQIVHIPEPEFRAIVEVDWSEAWKKHMPVLHIGERIVIRPSWLDYAPEPEDVVIQLDPGMAFGTGLHPTTQLCLHALERYLIPEADVLDVGTGTGILSIAAAKLGAKHILAVDNDPVAIRAARENVAENRVSQIITLREGDLGAASGEYDLVLINILARVILGMLDKGLVTRVRAGGLVIAAGLLDEQEADVLSAFSRDGLVLEDRQQIKDWVGLVARLP